MQRFSAHNFRSLAGGDAPYAVQLNHLETDLKEATYRAQQAEDRYCNVGNLVARLWNGDYDAALQLSNLFSLPNPGRWTDRGLLFSKKKEVVTCLPSCSHRTPRSPIGEITRHFEPLDSPLTSHKFLAKSHQDIRSDDDAKPIVLSPSRKFCSNPDYQAQMVRTATNSRSGTSSLSTTSSSGVYRPKENRWHTMKKEEQPVHKPNYALSRSSYRSNAPRTVAVPSRVLRNRGLYHSIPVVNIVPRSIPSNHIPSVIPSPYLATENRSAQGHQPSRQHLSVLQFGIATSAERFPTTGSTLVPSDRHGTPPLRKVPRHSQQLQHNSIIKDRERGQFLYRRRVPENTLARIYGEVDGRPKTQAPPSPSAAAELLDYRNNTSRRDRSKSRRN
ncbi:hypothetical protein BV898_13465 [Hypsibius exemplaris]|uniref:Uncharacterized protein n=1 Tax=Hypsibius exemplaris TaxID=2072580 RepID=A0A1W0WAS5_HYPEX|nr:hypothetical protein BV898_13465 [Hypsibius exemplaris]